MSAAVESAPVANPPAESTDNTQSAEVLASAAEGRRLYIGNLAYATTEGELKDFFKEYLVEGVSIPVNPRTTRPVGYAFVDLSTPSEAERAINELNGKNILDRKVSIQLARKPEATPEGGAKSGDESAGKTTRRRLSGRGRGRGRGGRAARGGRKTDDANGTEAAAEATNGTATNVPAQTEPIVDSTNKTKTKTKAKKGEEAATPADASKPRSPREPRERKQRGPPEDGVPSKTKVMVANLPYDLGEEKLLEIFKEYNPTSAKIALRPIPRFMIKKLQARNEPRKGRGFGFVTLASEEMQQKACAEMNGKEIEGREIAVKVAIDSPGKEDEDPSAESAEATPAAEATQAAPAAA
ncbi:uncharacterized protein PV09_08943 [Verruconis gallopava]|uniref:RRM domain-containing protein n=1 Tax=Verruconis gallopava TaxID=253628 RepID=A0A0D1XAZ8_9PEZI|nr:uncharacterized protein PV09_08943 [Verruconis gallopava]KIV99400.1 hypothetical protein PV09_08943 [Verruconis gallopava]